MHFSPQVALLEGLTDVLILVFFLHHSWMYDSWECLKFWKQRTNREVFRRVMIWAFVFGLPLNIVRCFLIASIKYRVGFLPASMGSYPIPYTAWPTTQRHYITPLSIVETVVWFLNLTIHWEETCFWFFLVFSRTNSKPWFDSIWFRAFLGILAIQAVVLSIMTGLLINNPLKLEAVSYLIYSLITFFQCGCFLYIFHVFPRFISQLYGMSGTSEVLSKLLSFHEINKIRVVARVVVAITVIIDAIDGLTLTQYINHDPAVVDLLLMTAVLSELVGSITTILVFLPRSPLREKGLVSRHGAYTEPKDEDEAVIASRGIKVPVSISRIIKVETLPQAHPVCSRRDSQKFPTAQEAEGVQDNEDNQPVILLKQFEDVSAFSTTVDLSPVPNVSNVEYGSRSNFLESRARRENMRLPIALRYYSSPIDIAEGQDIPSSDNM